MRNKCVQMSLEDIYNDVSKSMEDQKPALIELLETHIDFETIIPASFYNAFYQRYGRSHIYHLERARSPFEMPIHGTSALLCLFERIWVFSLWFLFLGFLLSGT